MPPLGGLAGGVFSGGGVPAEGLFGGGSAADWHELVGVGPEWEEDSGPCWGHAEAHWVAEGAGCVAEGVLWVPEPFIGQVGAHRVPEAPLRVSVCSACGSAGVPTPGEVCAERV